MKVDQEIQTLWTQLMDHGDIQIISDRSGIGPLTISKAINEGECTEKTFTAINDFFAEKKIRIDDSKSKIAS